MYWLIGGGALVIGWLTGWWFGGNRGYKRGKADALRELGRAELYDRRRKIRAYRDRARNKKPVQADQNRNKKR